MTALHMAIVGRCGRAGLRLLAVGGLAAMLAGCYQQTVVQSDYPNDYPNDYRLRHPITLTEGKRTVEVFLGRNRGGLTPSQRADVLSFAQIWRREATSGIIMDVPKGGSIDRAATYAMREIHSIFVASGVPRNAVYVRRHLPSDSSIASIKINYTKLTAQAGPCGRWPYDLGPAIASGYFENKPYWNFGCASQRNLAGMVDNPSDLVQPRGEAPSYTARRSVVIEKYRKGDNPSGTYNGYDAAAKISDIGK